MKLNELKPTQLTTSIQRIFDASNRLATQVDASIKDFTANHELRFSEAGAAGGILLIISILGKDAVNTLKIAEKLTSAESLQIHNALGLIMTGTDLGTATQGYAPKLALLVQAFLLAYAIGDLEEATHAIPADFEVTINADNSVSTADKTDNESL